MLDEEAGFEEVKRARRNSRPVHGQAQYLAQEQDYVAKLRASLMEETHGSPHAAPPLDHESSSENELSEDSDSLSGSESSLQTTDFPLKVNTNANEFKERTEWQVMLTSVLTGEVFTSEKSRMERTQNSTADDEAKWLELKAKVTCRTLAEQKRLVNAGRSTSHEVLERIMQFKLVDKFKSIEEVFTKVSETLEMLERCEALWPNRKAFREFLPLYGSPEFNARVDALTSWFTLYQSILEELELLRRATGNHDADPTMPPTDQSSNANGGNLPLVHQILKQEDLLMSMFSTHIQKRLFPLVTRARACTIEYSSAFIEMGLPLFLSGLNPIIGFPVKIMCEIIELRLSSSFKVSNITMTFIDESIARFQNYMSLGLLLTEEYLKITTPVLDKGWVLPNTEGALINKLMLRCIRFYLDLLSNKFLDGGHTTMSFFRSFKNIEQLELHFYFLQESCRLIDGGDISVAEKFTILHSRVLSRLLAYWEHQMEGPPVMSQLEINRWFPSTIENIRSIQRKLLRFYKTLCNTYENATDYSLPTKAAADFLQYLSVNKFFLVYTDSTSHYGTYVFATSELKEKPDVIKDLMLGHARPPAHSEPIGGIIIMNVFEALSWDGEILNLKVDMNAMPRFSGQVRLVVQGGYRELQEFSIPQFDQLKVSVPRKSQLARVDVELHKMRTVTYKLALSVITSAVQFHNRVKAFDCQDTVQAMFHFAKDFGHRSLPLISRARRERVVMKLFDLCVEWIEFVTEECPPSENKTFKWTVQALDFVMVMTKGVNILALRADQFQKLQRRVANCVTLLISHFDIMGARSKAATLTNFENRTKLLQLRQTPALVALKDDDAIIAASRAPALEKLEQLEQRHASKHNQGKILDKNNTEFEFLSFASSPFAASSMRWQRGQCIGSGAFGSVFKARDLDSFQLMAVKEVRITSSTRISKVLKGIKDEMTVLEMVSHPNIVKYYGVEVHREHVFIFMEYCPNGSLAHLLQDGAIQDMGIVQFFTLQIIEGLAYLHESGIVHRDIKPENILLKGSFIKIVDFGASKIITNPNNATTMTNVDALKGTPMYMAPEVIKGKPSAKLPSVDIWSIGCVLLQMVTGQQPWAECDNVFSIMYFIGANKRPHIPEDGIDAECRTILESTLQCDPAQRPTAMELLTDPWFNAARQTFDELAAANETFEEPEEEF